MGFKIIQTKTWIKPWYARKISICTYGSFSLVLSLITVCFLSSCSIRMTDNMCLQEEIDLDLSNSDLEEWLDSFQEGKFNII